MSADDQQQAVRRFRLHSRWRNLLLLLLFLWLLFWGLLMFVAPGLVRDGAQQWARALGRSLSIGEVTIQPWSMTVLLKQVKLRDRDGSVLFAAQQLRLDVVPRSLLLGHWHAELLAINQAELFLTRNQAGGWNWARLLADASAGGSKMPSDHKMPVILLDWLSISNARILLRDQLGGADQRHDLQRINFNLHDLSTLPSEGGYTLTAMLGDSTHLRWRGLMSVSPLMSSGRITLTGLSLTDFQAWFRPFLKLSAPEGKLSFDLNYVFDLKGHIPRLTVSSLFARLDKLSVGAPDGKSRLTLGQAAFEDGIFDLQKRAIFFKRVRLLNGNVGAIRQKNGDINWLAVLPPPGSVSTRPESPGWSVQLNDLRLENWQLDWRDLHLAKPLAVQAQLPLLSLVLSQRPRTGLRIEQAGLTLRKLTVAVAGQPAMADIAQVQLRNVSLQGQQIDLGQLSVDKPEVRLVRDRTGRLNLADLVPAPARPAASASTPAAWTVHLPTVALQDGQLRWFDQSLPAAPASLVFTPITGVLTPQGDGLLDLRLQAGAQRGSLVFDGQLDSSKGGLSGLLTARDLALSPLSPYISAQAPVRLPSGALSGTLRVLLKNGQWSLAGNAGVSNFRLLEAGQNDPLLAWRGLDLTGLRLSGQPVKLSIARVDIVQPETRLVLDGKRVSNWRHLFAAVPARTAAPVASTAVLQGRDKASPLPLAFDIRMVHIRNGDMTFADNGMNPGFRTRINHLTGSISGLSSTAGRRGALALNGTVDQVGDVRVRGALAPLAVTDNTDISLTFRNIPLNSLTPYSESFAGWKIEDGRLSVDLKYQLQNRQMIGDNRVVINSIQLGPQVERPGISRLPLSLAVAILEDSNGRIDLRLPVTGNLDDPAFSYGGLIWQAFANVIKKVATAPFRALGALFGIENFDEVRFIPGEAVVTPPERQKLDQLAQMLEKRPRLKLELAGTWDPEADRNQLARAEVDREILQAAHVDLAPGEPLPVIDPQDSEMQAAIKRVYAGQLGRLKLLGRLVAGSSNPDFYQGLRHELITATTISDTGLQALAAARAAATRQYLLQAYPDLASRIVLQAAKTAHASPDGVAMAITMAGL